ncbi:MAG: hypothetical protein M0P13_12615 [Fibrobacteraceae bacterium]|nr:hypothetical protein [Fibrobacteraceae bacterium]
MHNDNRKMTMSIISTEKAKNSCYTKKYTEEKVADKRHIIESFEESSRRLCVAFLEKQKIIYEQLEAPIPKSLGTRECRVNR